MEKVNCIDCKNINCYFKFIFNRDESKVKKLYVQCGQHIYLENMPVNGLYVVQSGCIHEHYINNKDEKEICHNAKDGEVFGHKDFNATKHLFSAVAVKNSSICLIDKSTLLEVCKNKPELSLKLINFFVGELNKVDNRYKTYDIKNG